MGYKLFIPISRYEVASGAKAQLQAKNVDAQNEKEERLIWSQASGYVNDKGIFTAPVLATDTVFSVNVCCQGKTSEEAIIEVLVKVAQEKQANGCAMHFEPRHFGSDGNYILHLQTVDCGGKGTKVVYILTDKAQAGISIFPQLPASLGEYGKIWPSGDENKFELFLKSDDDGFASIKLDSFEDKEREIHIRIKGSSLETEKAMTLHGPKKRKPFTYDKGKNIWNNFRKNYS